MSIWFFYEPVVKNGDPLNLTNLWKFNIQYAVRLAGQIYVQTPDNYPIWDLSNLYTNLMAKHHSNFVFKHKLNFLQRPCSGVQNYDSYHVVSTRDNQHSTPKCSANV